eukprot:scaffold137834_cov31-Tisochrysis_lutea.AAC.1
MGTVEVPHLLVRCSTAVNGTFTFSQALKGVVCQFNTESGGTLSCCPSKSEGAQRPKGKGQRAHLLLIKLLSEARFWQEEAEAEGGGGNTGYRRGGRPNESKPPHVTCLVIPLHLIQPGATGMLQVWMPPTHDLWLVTCAEGPSPSSATEPLPRDGGVRGWRMARPVYVARDAR